MLRALCYEVLRALCMGVRLCQGTMDYGPGPWVLSELGRHQVSPQIAKMFCLRWFQMVQH